MSKERSLRMPEPPSRSVRIDLAPPRRLAGSASGPNLHRPITLSDIATGAPKSDRRLVCRPGNK